MTSRIFSVGHSTHELTAFVRLLGRHEVTQVADVRAHPGSRRLPWFARSELARELPLQGLSYVHLPELGGRRRPADDSPNSGWRTEGFRAYADYMATPDFAAGLQRLRARAGERPTAMMCAEGLWWRCHRRLISDALTVDGWEVVHIDPRGEATTHELTSFAVPEAGRLIYPSPQGSLGRF
jgi:uncharacterized protein (DUF488 family)